MYRFFAPNEPGAAISVPELLQETLDHDVLSYEY